MSAAPRTKSARVVEPTPPVSARELFAHAASGVWAAVQGAGLAYAVVVLLAVVAVLDAPSVSGDDGGLGAGMAVATGLWLLGHGVPLALGDAVITVVPLGITVMALFSVHVATKRSAAPTLAAWVGGTVTYAAVVLVLVVGLAASGGTGGPEASASLLAQASLGVVGAAVVGGGGMALGMFSAPDGPLLAGITPRLDPYLPDTVRLGLRAGVVGTALLVGFGALLAGAWVVLGRESVAQVADGLTAGWLGLTIMLLLQLALFGGLVIWATAWLAGPGFAVGSGTVFSPAASESGPLPAVPVLGALPGPDLAGPVLAWVPVLVVGCGAVAGWFAWRRLEPALVRVRDLAGIVGGVVLSVGGLTAALQWAAGGSAGPGRMAEVGADVWLTAGITAAEIGAGVVAVLVGGFLRTWWRARSET